MNNVDTVLLSKDNEQIAKLLESNNPQVLNDIITFLFQHDPQNYEAIGDNVFYDPHIFKMIFSKMKDCIVYKQETFDKYLVDMAITKSDVETLQWMFAHAPHLATGSGKTDRGAFLERAFEVSPPDVNVIKFLAQFFTDQRGDALSRMVVNNKIEDVAIVLPYCNPLAKNSYAYQCAWVNQHPQMQVLLEPVSNPEDALYGLLCDDFWHFGTGLKSKVSIGALNLARYISERNLKLSPLIKKIIDNHDLAADIPRCRLEEQRMLMKLGVLYGSKISVASMFKTVEVIDDNEILVGYIERWGCNSLRECMSKVSENAKNGCLLDRLMDNDKQSSLMLMEYIGPNIFEQYIEAWNFLRRSDEIKQLFRSYASERQRQKICDALGGQNCVPSSKKM